MRIYGMHVLTGALLSPPSAAPPRAGPRPGPVGAPSGGRGGAAVKLRHIVPSSVLVTPAEAVLSNADPGESSRFDPFSTPTDHLCCSGARRAPRLFGDDASQAIARVDVRSQAP